MEYINFDNKVFKKTEYEGYYVSQEWYISQFKKGNYPKRILEKGILLERV